MWNKYGSQCNCLSSDHACVIESIFSALTHWGQNKVVDILQTTFSNAFFKMKIVMFDSDFTGVCTEGPIHSKSSLVQVVAWRQIGDKPLPGSMLNKIYRYDAKWSLKELKTGPQTNRQRGINSINAGLLCRSKLNPRYDSKWEHIFCNL